MSEGDECVRQRRRLHTKPARFIMNITIWFFPKTFKSSTSFIISLHRQAKLGPGADETRRPSSVVLADGVSLCK